MAQAEFHDILPVDRDRLFDVIIRYENYPRFVDQDKAVHVERKGPGHARATYDMRIVKDVSYTLDLKENARSGTVEWSLVESDLLKKNTGGWNETRGQGEDRGALPPRDRVQAAGAGIHSEPAGQGRYRRRSGRSRGRRRRFRRNNPKEGVNE